MTGVGGQVDTRDVRLVLYGLKGCLACSALETVFFEVSNEPFFAAIKVDVIVCDGDMSRFGTVRPRFFPTIIAFVDGAAKLGWEGFAHMSASEIQKTNVKEVFEQTKSLVMDRN
jgi:hypothetical protein